MTWAEAPFADLTASAQGHDTKHYNELIDNLFCRLSAPYGAFERIGEATVMAPDTIVRAELNRQGDQYEQYELLLFDGIDGFAGDLWEYGLRSLMRLDALSHPALPKIVSGRFDISEKVAFTLTDYPGEPFEIDVAVAWARSNHAAALEQFSLLLDALSELNGARLLHRNLTVGALRWTGTGERRSLRLCGFEMSTLVGDIMRRGGHRSAHHRQALRMLYLTAPPRMAPARHYAYLPPETHSYLFDNRAEGRHDWATTDVFGLGVFGWELFCGPIPEVLPEEYQAVVEAVEAGGHDGRASVRPALARLHDRMRSHLTTRFDLAEPLTGLLRKMLYSDPRSRDTSFQLTHHLAQHWDTLYAVMDGKTGQKPLVIAFMPEESVDTIYIERKWIPHSPLDPVGREELKAFLQRELAQAELVHSPAGAVGFVAGRNRDSNDVLAEAQSVLVGAQAVWFCTLLWLPGPKVNTVETEQVLVIRFLANREHARELVTRHPRRRIGAFELIPFRPPGRPMDLSGHPSWQPLLESVRAGRHEHPDDIEFLQSLKFLQEYQRTALNARCYPYRRVSEDATGTVLLEMDTARDDTWRHRSALLTAYSRDPRRRPPLGVFFDSVESRGPVVVLDVFPTRGDRPDFGRAKVKVTFEKKEDDDTIEVRVQGRAHIPAEGWIRPSDDSGTHPQLLRQERALLALENQAALISQLRHPTSIDFSRGRRSPDPFEPELKGNGKDVVDEMLSLEPFYALQGPPGTGKTMVAVRTLLRYLVTEKGARVLVSAQSNFALDHLARDLIKYSPPDILILRWVSDQAEDDEENYGSIDPYVRPHILNELTRNVVEGIQTKLAARKPGDRSAEETRLAEKWADTVKTNQIEISDRITAGANVVLATCSMAATLLESVQGAGDHFDWVLVEEAAKAWSTEIIIPLVLGTRWALIGDHRQLGAHRGQEVKEFLESLGPNNVDRAMRVHYDAREQRLRGLTLFGSLFDERAALPGAADAQRTASPLGRLRMQFRMHKDIAEPVGRAFYPIIPREYDEDGMPESFLETSPTANLPHGITRPAFLSGRALVWIDTGGVDGYDEQPRWKNRGEAELVARIVDRMRPPPRARKEEGTNSLVVLTPYAAQVIELNGQGPLTGRVHTVHSFQGRQADRVIVSLVRSRRTPGATVASNVGHVGQDEVANVLLSRARRLLVLVGNLRHFAEYGGPIWKTITTVIKRQGAVVHVGETGES